MKQKDLEEILNLAMGGKDVDSMTLREIKDNLITMTGIVVGMLLVTDKDPKEIKEMLK